MENCYEEDIKWETHEKETLSNFISHVYRLGLDDASDHTE